MGKIQKILTIAVVAVCSVMGGVKAMAEDVKSTLMVSPPDQEIILTPGEVYEGSLKVSNPNDATTDLKYSVSVGAFSQKQSDGSKDDYGTVDTETKTAYNQMMDWIELGKESGTVAPNTTDNIPFKIVVPSDAPAGGQYATILVRDDSKLGNTSGNVTINSLTQIASIIYAEVAGETHEEGAILENNVPSFLLDNKLGTTSMVQNNGNVHTDATYVLQVWPLFSDEEICTNEENPTTSLIMPETSKYYVENCNLPSMGIFRAKQTVKIFGETSIVEKTIIVCPIWMLFLIFFIIAAIIIWVMMRVQGRKKSTRSEKSEKSEKKS
ncbi:MAG: DUF916 domain-containing protein [Candidatus Saccharibacteria bacterium]|nr:DUF916 domain-containing protein [Candidatus Saccharibacteria bacterium]